MIRKEVKVLYKEGLHARPASMLTKLCGKFKSTIKLIKETKEIDPKSLLGVMTLGAACGDSLVIQVEGEDEAVAVASILEFFKQEG